MNFGTPKSNCFCLLPDIGKQTHAFGRLSLSFPEPLETPSCTQKPHLPSRASVRHQPLYMRSSATLYEVSFSAAVLGIAKNPWRRMRLWTHGSHMQRLQQRLVRIHNDCFCRFASKAQEPSRRILCVFFSAWNWYAGIFQSVFGSKMFWRGGWSCQQMNVWHIESSPFYVRLKSYMIYEKKSKSIQHHPTSSQVFI